MISVWSSATFLVIILSNIIIITLTTPRFVFSEAKTWECIGKVCSKRLPPDSGVACPGCMLATTAGGRHPLRYFWYYLKHRKSHTKGEMDVLVQVAKVVYNTKGRHPLYFSVMRSRILLHLFHLQTTTQYPPKNKTLKKFSFFILVITYC